MVKRIFSLSLLLSLVLFSLVMLISPDASAETIRERIANTQDTEDGLSDIEQTVDSTTSDAIKIIRGFAITGAIIFGVWLGWIYFFGTFSPDLLKSTKGRLLAFFAFLAFTFWTEKILGFLFNLIGVDITEYL